MTDVRIPRTSSLVWAKRSYCIPVVLIGCLFILCGCGIAGGTTRQLVSVHTGSPDQRIAAIHVASVSAAADAAELHTSGAQRWGKFDESDLANIRGTLEDTFAAAISRKQRDKDNELRVSVTIQRYIVAASNVEGAVLAAIDWCVARSDGLEVYREGFYANSHGRYIGTLGMLKDTLHRAIVRRIAESTIAFAGPAGEGINLPRNVSGTFDKLEDALAKLPEGVQSMSAPILLFKPVILGTVWYGKSEKVTVPWRSAKLVPSRNCGQHPGR